jgi:hypothetical protein
MQLVFFNDHNIIHLGIVAKQKMGSKATLFFMGISVNTTYQLDFMA